MLLCRFYSSFHVIRVNLISYLFSHERKTNFLHLISSFSFIWWRNTTSSNWSLKFDTLFCFLRKNLFLPDLVLLLMKERYTLFLILRYKISTIIFRDIFYSQNIDPSNLVLLIASWRKYSNVFSWQNSKSILAFFFFDENIDYTLFLILSPIFWMIIFRWRNISPKPDHWNLIPLNASNEKYPIRVRTTSYFYLHDKILT